MIQTRKLRHSKGNIVTVTGKASQIEHTTYHIVVLLMFTSWELSSCTAILLLKAMNQMC